MAEPLADNISRSTSQIMALYYRLVMRNRMVVAAWNGAGDINQLVDATPDKEWFEQYLGGFAKGKALEKGRRRREGAA